MLVHGIVPRICLRKLALRSYLSDAKTAGQELATLAASVNLETLAGDVFPNIGQVADCQGTHCFTRPAGVHRVDGLREDGVEGDCRGRIRWADARARAAPGPVRITFL